MIYLLFIVVIIIVVIVVVVVIIVVIYLLSAMKEKKNLIIQMAVVYDLIDILERFVTAPNVATEALSVIACLSDIGEYGVIDVFIRISVLSPLLFSSTLGSSSIYSYITSNSKHKNSNKNN